MLAVGPEQFIVCRGCDAVLSSHKARALTQTKPGMGSFQTYVCGGCFESLPKKNPRRWKVKL